MSALRAALRLAWRGIRREKGRSALIVVLIGLPVLAVTAFFTLYATYELDAREALPGRLGSADALIWAVGDVAVQSPDGSGWSSSGRGGPPPDEDAARALLRPGSRLLPYHRRTVAYPVEQGRIFLDVVELDLRDPLTRGMARLRQGRLPAAPGEVVVSAAMARASASATPCRTSASRRGRAWSASWRGPRSSTRTRWWACRAAC